MADSAKSSPDQGTQQPAEKGNGPDSLEKAVRSNETRAHAEKQDTDDSESSVSKCQWEMIVQVVAKHIPWTGDVLVQLGGAGQRFTADNQPTQMVDGEAAKVIFKGAGEQALTVTASAAHWRLVKPGNVTIDNGQLKVVELELEPVMQIEIRHEDGMMAAKKYALLPNKRRFKAVLTPALEGGEYVWEKLEGKPFDHTQSSPVVEVSGAEANTGDAEIKVSWSLGELSATAQHQFQIVRARIRHEDGTGEPKTTVLKPKVRTFKAVLEPAVGVPNFGWVKVGEKYTTAPEGDKVAIEGVKDQIGDASIQLTCKLDDQEAQAAHQFKVVGLAIRHEDGNSAPKEFLLKPNTRTFKAVLEPPVDTAKFQWPGGSSLKYSVASDKDKATVTGKEGETGSVEIAVLCTVDDQSTFTRHTFQILGVTMRDGDGNSEPKKNLLKPNTRTFKAVLQPAREDAGFQWTETAENYTATSEGAAATVTGKEGKTGAAAIEAVCTVGDQKASAKHEFKVFGLALRDGDGSSDPKPILLKPNGLAYKAVLQPSVNSPSLQWEKDGATYTAASKTDTLTVKGVEDKTGDGKIAVSYTLDGQTARVEHAFQVVGVRIVHEDGVNPAKKVLLKPNTRTFKAVVEPAMDSARLTWKKVADVYTLSAKDDTATVTARENKNGQAKITVTCAVPGQEATVEHGFQMVEVKIRHSDGTSDPKKTLLKPNSRIYKAVVTPAVSGAKFEWGDGGGAYAATSKTATLTVTGMEGKVGDAEAQVECTIDDQKAAAKHAFRIYELALKHADGTSAPKLRFLKQKQRGYKAVLNPPLDQGTYVWNPGGKMLSIGKGKNLTSPVQVTGAAATEATKLGVKYTLDDQSHQLSVDLTVVDVSVTPDVQGEAVDRTNGSTVELTAEGAPDESGHKWELGNNGFLAAIDGASDTPKLKIKAKKPGEVKAKLTYTLDGDKQECEGTAFFVEERIKSLKPENRAVKNIAEAAPETDKIVAVLLGIPNDPAVWETGNVDAEAEGKPAKLAKTKEDGEHEWTPPTDKLVRAHPTQPDTDHATDKSKLLLRALPTGANAGPPTGNPGYQDDEVAVKYTLHGVESEDKFKVRVHRYGCSQIHWVRKGKTGGTAVDLNDRPVICTHRGAPQWSSIVNATPPPGGDEVGVVDVLDPGGHQHGARCFVCSGAASASAATSPRHVWHWIPVTPRVLQAARGLANSVRTFARDSTQNGGPNSAWLTNELWDYLRPWEDAPTGGYYANKSKMLGVLVGQNSTGGDVWLTALSGFWNPTGPWLAPINIHDTGTSRTIPSAQGAGTVYTKTQAPFNTTAMTDGWGKLGRCAATALLGTALARGLKNLEMAEVWLDVNATLSPTATFKHTHEIGSCEQCRRYLGRMLCEVGT